MVGMDPEGNHLKSMAYELKEGETVRDLLDYAGGFAGDAYKSNIRVVRQNGAKIGMIITTVLHK